MPASGSDWSIPEPITSFVGRERAVTTVRDLLGDGRVRLVTLFGAGGMGKTRLAQRAAVDAAPDFADGAVFVDLSPIADPDLVPGAIAQAVNLPIADNRPIEERLKEHLADRNLLLVLDNVEHVIDAALFVAGLLAACQDLVILATSRIKLGIYGEYTFEVEPLSLPEPRPQPTLNDVSGSEAVSLFLERARAARSDFVLSETNAADVAEICRRLNGLPLAIELAAARVAHLSPGEMLSRSEQSLPLLAGGRRDLPLRLQSMHEAIAWSYRLLTPQQQALFRRLSVFAGGCTVETASAVVAEGGGQKAESVLDGLAALVDCSLLQRRGHPNGESRFFMLETIREFGLEQLAAEGEEEAARWAHTAYFLALAEQAYSEFRGSNPAPWFSRLESEHDNLRAALRWALADDGAGSETALRLCTALWLFWQQRGYLTEAIRWLDRSLEQSGDIVSLPRANTLLLRGYSEPDQAKSATYYEQALHFYRELGDRRRTAGALASLGMVATHIGDYAQAETLYGEGLAIFEGLGEAYDVAQAEFELGRVATLRGDYTRAKRHLDRARDLWQRLHAADGVAFALLELGRIHGLEGQYAAAENLLSWSLSMFQTAGFRDGEAMARHELGTVALKHGEHVQAANQLNNALALFADLGAQNLTIVATVEALAQIAHQQGKGQEEVALLSAMAAWRDSNGIVLSPTELKMRDRDLRVARRTLGERSFIEAWNRGKRLTLQEAIVLARAIPLQLAPTSHLQPDAAAFPFGSLTRREREVLCLIAAGFSNQAIADELTIAVRTTTTYVDRIFSKLAVDNRAAAAAHAIRHGICA